MNILFVCTDFNRSGAALAMIELAEKVKEFGNDVFLLYPGKGNAVEEAQKRSLHYKIIRSYEWVKPLNRSEKLHEKVKWALKHIYNIIPIVRICYLIKKEKIDIVHNNTLWGYVGPFSAKLLHVPYIWHMRELLEQQQQQLRWKKFCEKLISDSNALIAISGLVENNYKSRFPKEKIHLIYDGVDIKKMYRENHTLFQDEITKIMIAGGVRESKRQLDVVKAIEILVKKRINVHLSIVGDDNTDYAKIIKNYINENHLNKFITFCGETADIVSYWEKNDISVTASQFEAFGRVTAEAMLSGCVVVVSNSGANEEIVTHGQTGYVYELKDSNSLACILENILNQKDKAIECAWRGRNSVINRFSNTKNATQVIELYNSVLNKHQNT